MDDDGQLCMAGEFHLLDECELLHVARRMIVIVVQPDLTPGNDLGSFCQLLHIVERSLVRELRFMRMNPDRRINEFVLLGQQNSAIKVNRAVAIANGDDGLDAGLARPSNYLLAIGIEAVAFEMGVGVYEHSRQSLVVSQTADG